MLDKDGPRDGQVDHSQDDSTTYYSIDIENIDDVLFTKENTDHIVKYQKTV